MLVTATIRNGEVSFYHQDRGYGFIVPCDDVDNTSIFFHINRQRIFYADGGEELRWTSSKCDSSMYDLLPEIGDSLVFESEPAKGHDDGFRAKWWAQDRNYQQVLKQIAERPTYRLVQRSGREALSRLQAKPQYRVMWEGTNLPELRHRFPRDHYPIKNEEFLGRYFTKQEFGVVSHDGWEYCDDPR